MASHQDFVDYVAEQLRESGSIRSRKMFGEYGLYCDDIFFAVICDDQLFIKVTPAGEAAFPNLSKVPPYAGANDYIWVEDVDDRDTAAERSFASTPGEWIPAGIPLRPEGKSGPAPLPAGGVPHPGGERYRIFDALGRHPRGTTGEYEYGSRETEGQ